MSAEVFISRWSKASPSERANSQLFLSELCDLLGIAHPDPSRGNGYGFEYEVTEHHPDGTTSQGRIDLYKRACFVLESKQFQEAHAEASQLELAAEEAGVIAKKKSSQPVRGTGAWDDAMTKARGQAEHYLRALPEDNPPFIVVVDVGHTFELFADFSQAGRRTKESQRARSSPHMTPETLERLLRDPAASGQARNARRKFHRLMFTTCALTVQTSSQPAGYLGPLDKNLHNGQLRYMRRPATTDFTFPNATSGQTYCSAKPRLV